MGTSELFKWGAGAERPAVTGELLHAGWQHTDTLQLDLYGSKPTGDDGYQVESVTVHGHHVDICELFTGRQLELMGEYLDFKDDTNPNLRAVADRKRSEAMRPPYDRNRGLG